MPERRTLTLSDDQREDLLYHRDHSPRPDVRERCAALLKIAEGQSPYAVALHGLLRERDPDTVYAWLDCYQRDGLVGILRYQHGGARHNSPDRKEQVLQRLRQGPSPASSVPPDCQAQSQTQEQPTPATAATDPVDTPQQPPSSASNASSRATEAGPGAEASSQPSATASASPSVQGNIGLGPSMATRWASCWTLASIRDTFDWMRDYSLSGVWRALDRMGLKIRSAGVQHYSPDPQYASKLINLEMALWETQRYPGSVVTVFLDEMGFSRWPEPGPDWGNEPPVTDRRTSNNGTWRLIGALNALTGRVDYLDGYIVGRAKVIEFYGQLVEAYPGAEKLYVVQDNWSIHSNPEVLEALKNWPQVEPVWLPTYAPWLNPIEKLWRWARHDIFKMHRLADDWKALRRKFYSFLDQFAEGSQRLLEYVGLLGSGLLAQMLHP